MSKPWSQDEVDYLKESYGKYSDEHISEKLLRSIDSIRSKSMRIGITKKDNGEYLTVTDFCEEAKISQSTISYWINNFDFPVKKCGKYRKVNRDRFWLWADKNRSRINWPSLPKIVFTPWPKWAKELSMSNSSVMFKRSKWSEFEVNQLKFMLKNEKYTYLEISEALNRSHSAVRRKIYDLGLLYTPIQKSTQNKYTQEEIDQAAEMLTKGISLNVVAKKINRSEMGLAGKMEREGYYFENKILKKR